MKGNILLLIRKIKYVVSDILEKYLPSNIKQRYSIFQKKMMLSKIIVPKTIAIENTTYCNSACVFCPHGIPGKLKRPKATMTNEAFFKIVNKCKREGIEMISFGGLGEFLVDRGFFEKALYCKEKGLLGNLTTNGMLINKEVAEKIIKLGFRDIYISIDSANKEKYEALRINLKLSVVLDNTKYLIERIISSGCNTRINIDSIYFTLADIREDGLLSIFGKYIGPKMRMYFSPLHNWGGEVGSKRSNSLKPCERLFTSHLLVRVDGSVGLCCLDFNNILPIGNALGETSFLSMWNSPMIMNMRRMHVNGGMNKISVCKDCDDIRTGKEPIVVIDSKSKVDHYLK